MANDGPAATRTPILSPLRIIKVLASPTPCPPVPGGINTERGHYQNFVYVVVSQRGGGSMVISPQGKILVEGKGPDDIAIVDIDPFGDREGGTPSTTRRTCGRGSSANGTRRHTAS